MPNTVKAECPNCGKTANGKGEIEQLFGWRTVNGKEVPQSWCYECRSNERRS